jgi:hypothetical protein
MKKLTGIVAVAFVAGMIGGSIGEQVADEVWTSKTALAAEDPYKPGGLKRGTGGKFSIVGCDRLARTKEAALGLTDYSNLKYQVGAFIDVIRQEHCGVNLY